MDLDFALIADGISVRQDGKLDIYGAGFDTISASAVPAQHPRLMLAVRVLISRHEAERPHELDIFLQTEDGNELARAQSQLQPLPAEQRDQVPAGRQIGVGLLLAFNNLVFPQFGSYQLVIHWDGNEARAPLHLLVAQQSPA
jgi:hypothetical protein